MKRQVIKKIKVKLPAHRAGLARQDSGQTLANPQQSWGFACD